MQYKVLYLMCGKNQLANGSVTIRKPYRKQIPPPVLNIILLFMARVKSLSTSSRRLLQALMIVIALVLFLGIGLFD